MAFSTEVFLIGAISGLLYALLAAGLVLVYRSTGVINFAYGQLGALCAAVLAKLVDVGWPFWPSLAVSVLLGAVLSGRRVPVTALKGHLGHLQGAAGAVEALATALTLHHGLIPPTIGCAEQDRAIALDVVTRAPRPLPADGDLALTNSFGFGGHNAVLALRRA